MAFRWPARAGSRARSCGHALPYPICTSLPSGTRSSPVASECRRAVCRDGTGRPAASSRAGRLATPRRDVAGDLRSRYHRAGGDYHDRRAPKGRLPRVIALGLSARRLQQVVDEPPRGSRKARATIARVGRRGPGRPIHWPARRPLSLGTGHRGINYNRDRVIGYEQSGSDVGADELRVYRPEPSDG